MADTEAIIRRFGQAKARRHNWDSTWQDIADRVWPSAADFNVMRLEGERRTEKMFDGTPAIALQKFSAAIESFTVPRNMQWHGLQTDDRELNKSIPVKRWMEDVTRLLFDVRYSPRSSYAAQVNEVLTSYGAFGTGGIYIEDMPGRGIRYKSLPLARTWILENDEGLIDTVCRCIPRSSRQLAQEFGIHRLPDKVRVALEKTPDSPDFELLHYVAPREDFMPGKFGVKGLPWLSCYLLPDIEKGWLLREGGYQQWPFAFARYLTGSGEVYARSPAWLALSNIKVLNQQKRTLLKAGQRAVTPPLLVVEDGALAPFNLQPDAINYGTMSMDGKPLVAPLQTNTQLDIGLDMMDREREIIGAGFLLDVFTALVENPQMTATQALELLQERANIAAPVVGRLQCEFLGSQIERELQIMEDAGQLPPIPEEMIEAGASLRIEYTSPMNRAMRAGDGIAIIRTLEAAIPLAQIDESALDGIKVPESMALLADINGMPADLRRSEKEIKALREGRASRAEAEALVNALPAATQAAANMVKLQQNYGRPVA